MLFFLTDTQPQRDGSDADVEKPGEERLATVEFKGCASAKMGVPNDEVFEDDTVTLPMNIYFDHTTQVAAPGYFNLLIAHVKTFTGKTYDFLPDTQPDPKGLIVKSAITAPGATNRLVVLTANEPTL